MINLSPRLGTAASFVRAGCPVADIGTDHAYIPAWLVLSGISDKCIAADIGEGPLQNAAKTLERYGISDRVSLRLSDGLKNFSVGEVEEIIICGMGGTLIEDILTASPWVKNDGVHLILQPMTHIENVRKYLCENGFSVEKEAVVFDDGRYYLTISAFYKGCDNDREVGYYYFGDGSDKSEGAQSIIEKTHKRVVKRLTAIKAAGRFPEEQKELVKVLSYYEDRIKNDGK